MSHDWRVWLLNIATFAVGVAPLVANINPAWSVGAATVAAVGNQVLHVMHVNDAKINAL